MSFLSKESFKKLFLINSLNSKNFLNKFIYKNSLNIPMPFYNTKLLFYNGRFWNKKYINLYMIGFKSGEFIWTRKRAIFKNKQKKNKKK